ncbi:MAG: PilZ domain-containing protein [Nitrospirota bacterium]|nr:PilZ domain-containing protein [Nitrospirota bacterium]
MALRSNTRFSIRCPIAFSGDDIKGDGAVINISKTGWMVASNHWVQRGTYLTLRIALPDQEIPLEVDQAVVRWSTGHEFGLEFLSMQPDAQERLNRFLSTLETSQGT